MLEGPVYKGGGVLMSGNPLMLGVAISGKPPTTWFA